MLYSILFCILLNHFQVNETNLLGTDLIMICCHSSTLSLSASPALWSELKYPYNWWIKLYGPQRISHNSFSDSLTFFLVAPPWGKDELCLVKPLHSPSLSPLAHLPTKSVTISPIGIVTKIGNVRIFYF